MQQLNWYDHPECYDLVFEPGTRKEIDLFLLAIEMFAGRKVERVLEPACGTGRILSRLAHRGFDCFGFDLSPAALDYAERRLRRRGLRAQLWQDDMTRFAAPEKADAALCTIDTFRHLLTEAAARAHLRCAAAVLKRGGIYLIGLHLLPDSGVGEPVVEWASVRGKTKQRNRLELLEMNPRTRRERLLIEIKQSGPAGARSLFTEFTLRVYKLAQLQRLLESVPEFRWVGAYDDGYELREPCEITSDHECVFLVLCRV